MFPSQKFDFLALFDLAHSASMRPGCFHPRNTTAHVAEAGIGECFNEAGMFPSQKSRRPSCPKRGKLTLQ